MRHRKQEQLQHHNRPKQETELSTIEIIYAGCYKAINEHTCEKIKTKLSFIIYLHRAWPIWICRCCWHFLHIKMRKMKTRDNIYSLHSILYGTSILGCLKMFVDCCKIKATLRGIGYITLSKMRKKNTEPYHILQRGNRGRIWSKLSLLKLCANLRRPQPRWNLKQKNYKFLFTT